MPRDYRGDARCKMLAWMHYASSGDDAGSSLTRYPATRTLRQQGHPAYGGADIPLRWREWERTYRGFRRGFRRCHLSLWELELRRDFAVRWTTFRTINWRFNLIVFSLHILWKPIPGTRTRKIPCLPISKYLHLLKRIEASFWTSFSKCKRL